MMGGSKGKNLLPFLVLKTYLGGFLTPYGPFYAFQKVFLYSVHASPPFPDLTFILSLNLHKFNTGNSYSTAFPMLSFH